MINSFNSVFFIFGVSWFAAVVTTSEDCPRGWLEHQQSCYFFSRTSSPWGSAVASNVVISSLKYPHPGDKSICQTLQSSLAEIETQNEDIFIRNYLLTNHTDDKKGYYYIGGNDIEVENEYIWSSSRQTLAYTNWAKGQPDSVSHNGDDCISLNYYSGYKWHDTQCGTSIRFICEARIAGTTGEIIG